MMHSFIFRALKVGAVGTAFMAAAYKVESANKAKEEKFLQENPTKEIQRNWVYVPGLGGFWDYRAVDKPSLNTSEHQGHSRSQTPPKIGGL